MHSHSRPATCPKRCSCSRDAFHLPLTACALQEDCSYGALANILVCELHAGCIRDALAIRMRFRCTFSGICLSTRHRAHPQTFSHVPHMSCLRCKCPAVPNRVSTSEGSDCFLVPDSRAGPTSAKPFLRCDVPIARVKRAVGGVLAGRKQHGEGSSSGQALLESARNLTICRIYIWVLFHRAARIRFPVPLTLKRVAMQICNKRGGGTCGCLSFTCT